MASDSEDNEITVIEIDSLKEILECPVCNEVSRNGPIHQCKNGHIVCNRCNPKLQNDLCPTCRDPIVGRAMNIEKLLDLIPNPCKYSESGCKTELVPSLLRNHENNCETKLLHCPRLFCTTKILPKYLDQHLIVAANCKVIKMSNHATSSLYVSDDIFTKKKLQSWVPGLIHQFGQTFFTEVLRTEYGNWIFWIYFLGSENEAKNYNYKITICNSDETVQSIYSGQVISMRRHLEAILKRPNGLILSDEMVKKYLENSHLTFKITLLMPPVNQVKRPLIGGKRTNPHRTIDAQKQKRNRT
jgi:hypothetical protein